jgi:PadR family transcriptional regulator PadR
MNSDDRFNSIRKGLLEFAVLNVISAKPAYAADILASLGTTEFATQEGTLYPLLSKLRRDSLLEYDWEESASGPPRKYYRLTDKGTQQLSETQTYWESIIKTIKNLSANV